MPTWLAQTDVTEFLRAAYDRVLGREPDPHGEHHYRQQLTSGSMGYRDVLAALLTSDEAARCAASEPD